MDIIILGFITSFFVVLLATPSLIKVAKLKHLVDEPTEERKLHIRSVPTIGGITIFAGILFSYSLWFPSDANSHAYENFDQIFRALSQFKYLVACLIILFFVGIKDDIIGTAPVKKLLAHIMVGFILVVMANIRITSMGGIFGVNDLEYWASVFLSVFAYIVIVNAFNLIDGIDGLAGGIGAVTALFFGVWFYLAGNLPFSLLAFVLAGSLCGFLVFNFSPAKLFMGDSGSLIIGVIVSVLAINMIEQDTSKLPPFLNTLSKPILAMSILVYPLIDTLRIFIYRAMKGRSPFSPDKNHIHHRLIKLGLNHRKTVTVLYLYNIFVVLFCLFVGHLSVTICFLLTAVFAAGLIGLLFIFKPKEKQIG